MQLLEVSLASGAENVALDEALLEEAEEGRRDQELLRLWELPHLAVILGRSSRLAEEVRVAVCQQRSIEVVRRSSGGAAVVGGPGCLMYSLLLSYEQRPDLRHIDRTHDFVLGRIAAAFVPRLKSVAHRGTSDLALGPQKFSGNSLRCKRDWMLYHGTLLYDFPLALIGELLAMPPRQPEYRQRRNHDQFVTNLPLGREELRQLLIDAFDAREEAGDWPRGRVQRLVGERFGNAEWTAQR